jgi:hypothetical protein
MCFRVHKHAHASPFSHSHTLVHCLASLNSDLWRCRSSHSVSLISIEKSRSKRGHFSQSHNDSSSVFRSSRSLHGGQQISFCCPNCFKKFSMQPTKFVNSTTSAVPQQFIGQTMLCPGLNSVQWSIRICRRSTSLLIMKLLLLFFFSIQ